jgi:RNA polymerase sigma-70 factor (ECF subfamily)
MDNAELQIFEATRPRLLGLAYRILGSRADADDAVQDCFLKWREAVRTQITTPIAWPTTACTRRCLDMLGAADRVRVDYAGPWLPEPIHPASPVANSKCLVGRVPSHSLAMLPD